MHVVILHESTMENYFEHLPGDRDLFRHGIGLSIRNHEEFIRYVVNRVSVCKSSTAFI